MKKREKSLTNRRAARRKDFKKIVMAKPVRLTIYQKKIFEYACDQLRSEEQDFNISEGRCLELIAAEYIAGVKSARHRKP